MRAHSWPPIAVISAMRSAIPVRGRKKSAASRMASSTAAVLARLTDRQDPSSDFGALRLLELLARAAEAPLALAVRPDRLVERRSVEIRPQRLGEIELGISELPEEEVRDALLAPGADEQIGLGRIAHREVWRERRFVDRGASAIREHAVHRLQDVPASAVVRRDGEGELTVVRGERLAARDQLADLGAEALDITHDFQTHAVRVQLFDLVLKRAFEKLHEERHFLGGAAPVLRTEGEERKVLDAALAAGAHRGAHRFCAAAVAGDARQAPTPRPAPVAIHDDGDVARHVTRVRNAGGGAGFPAHTAISSFSLSASRRSMSAMCRSVIFCISSSARRSSFSEISCFFSASFRWWIASRRRFRTATRAFSASCFTTLMSSLRRSSVSGGIGSRIVSPLVVGFKPRSASRIAFSTVVMSFFSNGVTPMVRASRRITLATWLSGVGVP